MTWTSDQQTKLLALIRQRSERDVLRNQLKHTEADLNQQQIQQQQLYDQLLQEEQDVDRLERLSWATLYYNLLNRREEQLTKEQAEAEVVLSRYEETKAYGTDLQSRKTELLEKLAVYAHVDNDYDALIQQKTGTLLVQQGDLNEQYKARISALTLTDKHLRELEEAHTAGLKALNEVIQLVQFVGEARSLGNWDMFTKSVVFSMQKYQKLDQVKHQSYRVSWHLKQFKSEFADLNQTTDANWEFDDGLTQFVDIFFDNFFTDWSVQRRIERLEHEASMLEMKLVHSLKMLKKELEQAITANQNRGNELRLFLEQA